MGKLTGNSEKNNGYKRKAALALSLFAILAAIAAAVAVMMTKQRGIDLTIDGAEISEDEFLQAVDTVEFGVTSYFRSKYDADTDGDFWTRDYEGEVPCMKLAEAAVEELRYRYAIYRTAEEKGYLEHMTYSDRQKRLEEVNEERKALKESGEVIYGLTEYSMEQYLDLEMSLLKERYCNDSSNADMAVSEEELRDYYENGGEIIGEDGETIPLEEVRSAVEGRLRQLRYDEMIEKHAATLRVEVDEERLFTFTLVHI